jgi:hypothetical protein
MHRQLVAHACSKFTRPFHELPHLGTRERKSRGSPTNSMAQSKPSFLKAIFQKAHRNVSLCSVSHNDTLQKGFMHVVRFSVEITTLYFYYDSSFFCSVAIL